MQHAKLIAKFRELDFGEVRKISPVAGGCIHDAYRVEMGNDRTYFCKTGAQDETMYAKEAHGLRELTKADALRIPNVLHADSAFLILEWIERRRSKASSSEKFGADLAKLHQYFGDEFGFFEDNFIGSTPQKNLPRSLKWSEFFIQERLVFQLRLAERNGLASAAISKKMAKLVELVDSILQGSEERPCLIHGDLWGGNYFIDEFGQAVLIDPAVYYGHREAELALARLFGGFSPEFFHAYNRAYPLKEGWERREKIYQLYHLLNHLNLCGSGYLSDVEQAIDFYV